MSGPDGGGFHGDEFYGTYERLRAAGVEMCGDCMTLCRPESRCACCAEADGAGQ